jgi:hypothetical protein
MVEGTLLAIEYCYLCRKLISSIDHPIYRLARPDMLCQVHGEISYKCKVCKERTSYKVNVMVKVIVWSFVVFSFSVAIYLLLPITGWPIGPCCDHVLDIIAINDNVLLLVLYHRMWPQTTGRPLCVYGTGASYTLHYVVET